MDAPPHETMRIWVTPVQQWDVYPTRLFVEAACYDAEGNKIHTAVHTGFTYLDVPASLALCKDFHYILGIIRTEKLVNKPVKCEVIVNDLLAFLYLTKQIHVPRKDQQSWVSKAHLAARKSGIEVQIKLGTPEPVEAYRLYSQKEKESIYTPSLEATGDKTRAFIREEKKWKTKT